MTRLVLAALAVVGMALYMLGRRASGPAPTAPDPTDAAGDYGWPVTWQPVADVTLGGPPTLNSAGRQWRRTE